MAKRQDLTVIVPAYNEECYIEECVLSIINQNYKSIQIIIVDDGSTDRTGAICDKLESIYNEIKVYHIENRGIYGARKYGLEKTCTEYVTFVDSDDWIDVDAYKIGMQYVKKYNLDIFLFNYEYNGVQERHAYKEGLYKKEDIRTKILQGMIWDYSYGGRKINPSMGCKIIKTQLFENLYEVDERISYGEDALFTYPLLCIAENIYIIEFFIIIAKMQNPVCILLVQKKYRKQGHFIRH